LISACFLLTGGALCQQNSASGQAETGKRNGGISLGGKNNNQDNKKILIGTDLVSLPVTVTDSQGRFVSGLTKDHFLVYDKGVQQQITHFSNEDAPVSIGIVYDVSRSMRDRMKQSLRALQRFIETSHADDDLFLITFNDRARLAQDFTTSGDQIIERLKFTRPSGSTALYDAAYLALEKVQQGRHPKRALLIISDGEDNYSRYNGSELRARVREADVQIYAIGLTDAFSEDLKSTSYGRSLLESITKMTGGRAFFPNAYKEELLIEICARIALELRSQYSIGFYPSSKAGDGTWHRIQVKLKPPKGLGRVSLSHRSGYQSIKK
jgi:Ca-activated chloride channel family protein